MKREIDVDVNNQINVKICNLILKSGSIFSLDKTNAFYYDN